MPSSSACISLFHRGDEGCSTKIPQSIVSEGTCARAILPGIGFSIGCALLHAKQTNRLTSSMLCIQRRPISALIISSLQKRE